MKEYVIQEDRGRLALYTGLFLLLMVVLMIASIAFFAVGWYLFSFLGITGLWFDVKAMFRYGNKLVRKKPVCEFGRDGLTIYYLPGKPREMKYRQVKEARSIRTRFTLKLFFRGDNVEHPSGWYYAGVIYPFQSKKLDEVEENTVNCLKKHGIDLVKTEKVK